MKLKPSSNKTICIALIFMCISFISSCGFFKTTYKVGKGALKGTYFVTKTAVKGVIGTGKVVYKVGEFTFKVVMAPVTWPLTRDEIETIDGLSPKEAIKQGRVKMAPYVVNGKRYVPMSLKEAVNYEEKGIASWYGDETRRQKGGHMTANGEAFDPDGFNAAHKYLPLPSHLKVTNLENGKSIIIRVNDRGPFVDNRIIDLSAGAAKKLGYYKKGTARVRIESIQVES
ncbi:septal ring lytic transglycosylase RlpA family protein [Thermodesulfobacteriota bacterium]